MSDMKAQIKKVLKKNGCMTARDIASAIGCSRSEVNSFIYYCDDFEKDDSFVPLWSIKGSCSKTKGTKDKGIESDPVMLKLQNRDEARTFTQKEFDRLASWDDGEAYIDREVYVTHNGRIIQCDSTDEVLLLQYLDEHNLVKDVGGQALQIKYDTAFRSGCSYQPDIVALTHDHHIAIFEVKTLGAMSNHSNVEKYRFLTKYCKEHGYMYVMIAPKAEFTSFEELRDMDVGADLAEMFDALNEKPHTPRKPYKHFDTTDVKQWYKKYGQGETWEKFKIQVHSLVIQYNWYNVFKKDGFNVFSRPVKQMKNDDGTYSVIDYK